MGAFRVNLFYLLGMLGTTAAVFLANSDPSGFLLNSSLFFAFARFYPDTSIYLLFILPVKVKWMAWVSAALLLLNFLSDPGVVVLFERYQFRIGSTWAMRVAVLVALANYLVFFGREIVNDARHRQDVTQRRRRFESAVASDEEALHRCEVCGRTELVAPDMDFRVAKDGHEYCAEHLPKASPSVQA
jgi:hypothetical protein